MQNSISSRCTSVRGALKASEVVLHLDLAVSRPVTPALIVRCYRSCTHNRNTAWYHAFSYCYGNENVSPCRRLITSLTPHLITV